MGECDRVRRAGRQTRSPVPGSNAPADGYVCARTVAASSVGARSAASEFVDLPVVLVGIAFICVIAAINFRGISESAKTNMALTAVELFGLLLVIVIGLAFRLDGGGDSSRALEFKQGETVSLAILAGASLAFFALIGFEDSVNVTEEPQDPARNYPRADDITVYGYAAGLLALGAVLWAINRVLGGPHQEIDPAKLID